MNYIFCLFFRSGISEGSIGSPEPHNLSMSPLRAVSPDASHQPSTTQGSYNRYSDDHRNIPSNSTISHDTTYDQHVREQQSLHNFHPLYDPLVEKYDPNHPYNKEADGSRDRNVYWDRQSHQDSQQIVSNLSLKILISRLSFMLNDS